MWIELEITRETEDESKDFAVQVWVSEGIVGHYAKDDGDLCHRLTEAEQDQVRNAWERLE